jgi:hypothetical protein
MIFLFRLLPSGRDYRGRRLRASTSWFHLYVRHKAPSPLVGEGQGEGVSGNSTTVATSYPDLTFPRKGGRYSKGFDTTDLQEAMARLEELR